jgi:cell shape-determining protein MreD
MRAATFVVAAWVFLGLEVGLRDALRLGDSGVAPSFLLVLMTFVAMNASMKASVASGLVLGLLIDLTSPRAMVGGLEMTPVVGPHAIGAFVGAYGVYLMRTLVVRQNPVTMMALAIVGSALTHAVAGALLEARSWVDSGVAFAAGQELVARGGSSLYTGVVALVVGPVLRWLAPMFGFASSTGGQRRRIGAVTTIVRR